MPVLGDLASLEASCTADDPSAPRWIVFRMAAAVALADACICDVNELISLVVEVAAVEMVVVSVEDKVDDDFVVTVVVVMVVVAGELSAPLLLLCGALSLVGDWSRWRRSPRIPLEISM